MFPGNVFCQKVVKARMITVQVLVNHPKHLIIGEMMLITKRKNVTCLDKSGQGRYIFFTLRYNKMWKTIKQFKAIKTFISSDVTIPTAN